MIINNKIMFSPTPIMQRAKIVYNKVFQSYLIYFKDIYGNTYLDQTISFPIDSYKEPISSAFKYVEYFFNGQNKK